MKRARKKTKKFFRMIKVKTKNKSKSNRNSTLLLISSQFQLLIKRHNRSIVSSNSVLFVKQIVLLNHSSHMTLKPKKVKQIANTTSAFIILRILLTIKANTFLALIIPLKLPKTSLKCFSRVERLSQV